MLLNLSFILCKTDVYQYLTHNKETERKENIESYTQFGFTVCSFNSIPPLLSECRSVPLANAAKHKYVLIILQMWFGRKINLREKRGIWFLFTPNLFPLHSSFLERCLAKYLKGWGPPWDNIPPALQRGMAALPRQPRNQGQSGRWTREGLALASPSGPRSSAQNISIMSFFPLQSFLLFTW